MTNSTVSGNTALYGGGIGNEAGTATIMNSTVSGNSVAFDGSGIENFGGTLTLVNSTVSGNSAGKQIDNPYSSLTVTLVNTIVATTAGTACGQNVAATSHNNVITDASCGLTNGTNGNIVGQDPQLGPLQDNGGPTRTQALGSGSPAIQYGQFSGLSCHRPARLYATGRSRVRHRCGRAGG